MEKFKKFSVIFFVVMLCVSVINSSPVIAADAPKPLVIKVSVDHSGTQASSYCEQELLKKGLEERIPGTEVRMYYSSSLYGPVETMNQLVNGNLEMAIQDGDASGWDPWLNMQVWPMVLSTVGAHAEFDNTALAKMFVDRLDKRGVKVFGFNHQSTFGGIISPKRMLTLDDVKGKKIRVSGILTQGPMVRSWGAIPIAMGWGEVPSSLQSGVIDAALTTVGAWRSVQDIAPFYTVLGVGGVFTDFDIVMASKKWWDGLSKVQQDALKGVIEKFVDEFAYWQNSEDQLGYKAFGTIDPKKPGIYIAKEDEIAPFRDAVGNKMAENLIKELGEEIRPWAEGFIKEGVEISQKWPTGSHPCEKIDFEEYRSKINMK